MESTTLDAYEVATPDNQEPVSKSPNPPVSNRRSQDATQLGLEKEQKLSKEERDEFLAQIKSFYLKEAAKEDKELADSWTETLNIILTFGGLLSAVITAFLLALAPDLRQDPNDVTNGILLHILNRMDNTTLLSSNLDEPFTPAESAVRCLAWWHTSLGCSLTSTFGALLGKLWVIHYQSNPHWADTEDKQSRLREARFDSLERWHMYAIIESLPLLLQLSVFLFYVGLAQSLHSTTTLFVITIIFASVMGALFALTLFAGAFFPSCPYKSNLSRLLLEGISDLWFWTGGALITIPISIKAILLPNSTSEGDSSTTWQVLLLWNKLRHEVADHWSNHFAYRAVENNDLGLGERRVLDNDPQAAGILCWWIQAPHLWGEVKESIHDDLVDAMKEADVNAVMETNRWKENFQAWSTRVISQLYEGPCTRSIRLQADAVFHFMHHSPSADRAAILAIGNSKGGKSLFQTLDVYISKSIRNGWARGGATRTLPITSMYPSTVSVCYRHHLLHWCRQEKECGWERGALLDELPAVLARSYLTPDIIEPHMSLLLDTISLASLALIPTAVTPSPHLEDEAAFKKPLHKEPFEQLLRAVSRLSCVRVQEDTLSQQSLVSPATVVARPMGQKERVCFLEAIKRACNLITCAKDGWEKTLYDSPSWTSGDFSRSVGRLLVLGSQWLSDSETKTRDTGLELIKALHSSITQLPRGDRHKISENFVFGLGEPTSYSKLGLEKVSGISENNLCTILDTCARSELYDSDPQIPLQALDYALGLRYYFKPPSYKLRSLFEDEEDQNPTISPSPITPIKSVLPLDLVAQLAANLRGEDTELRKWSLSIVMKGYDVFLPFSIPNAPDLQKDIDEIKTEISSKSKNLLVVLTEPFDKYARLGDAVESFRRTKQQEEKHTATGAGA